MMTLTDRSIAELTPKPGEGGGVGGRGPENEMTQGRGMRGSDDDVDRSVDRGAHAEAREGVRDERSPGTGWDTQGRVRLDVGRKARTLGHQWPSLRGLG